MNATEMLGKYRELEADLAGIKAEMKFLESLLEEEVARTKVPLSAFGLVAHYKPGKPVICGTIDGETSQYQLAPVFVIESLG